MGRPRKQPTPSAHETLGHNAANVLQDYVAQLDKFDDELHTIRKAQKEVFNNAKQNGFATGPLKEVMKRRKMQEVTRIAFYSEVEADMKALGLQMELFEYVDKQDATGQSTEAEADGLAA